MCMLGIVQTDTSYCSYVVKSDRRKQLAHVDDLIGDCIRTPRRATYYPRLDTISDVAGAIRKDGVPVVRATISGCEADEALNKVHLLVRTNIIWCFVRV